MPDHPAFHFPPDVFNAVVDAVPLLTRSKRDVLIFFQGCGVDRALLTTLDGRIGEQGFGKYQITKEILTYLNSKGDGALGARRQVIKRVSEYDEFSSCYPDNQLKAKGAVAAVAELVNKKDSFTRMQLAHEEEQRKHREAKADEIRAQQKRRTALEEVRSDLFKLFGEKDPAAEAELLNL